MNTTNNSSFPSSNTTTTTASHSAMATSTDPSYPSMKQAKKEAALAKKGELSELVSSPGCDR